MHWMKYKYIYFSISGLFILISLFSLAVWKLKLGIDFTGGAVIEYKFSKSVSKDQLTEVYKNVGVSNISISSANNNQDTVKTEALSKDQKSQIDSSLKNVDDNYQELSYEVVGPSIGPELIQKTIYAVILSAGIILLWVAIQFRNIKYGLAAVLAMLHDSLVLLGSFSLFGHFLNVEIDFLFVTAMLTILSFSVHDTIVVFDRIRETSKRDYRSLTEIADGAVTQTMTRSLNNSFTIIYMLVALVLLGGTTIRWFAVALLIGTISGTYSSPFVAIPLLLVFDNIKKSKFFRKK